MGKNRRDRNTGHGALKAIIITVSVLVLLAGAAAAVYFLVFGTVTIVSDTSFPQIIPSGTYTGLRLDLALQGKRLKVVTLQEKSFSSPEVFSASLVAAGGDRVILTPVPAAYAVINMVDVSELLPDSVVIGIHDGSGTSSFDVTLVSDVLSGWTDAAHAIQEETASMPQNIALVYEKNIDELTQDIVDLFPAGHVTEFRKDTSSRMFPSTTYDKMDEQGIVIAMCPYISGFASFFGTGHDVFWIVDYRFALTVPAANLYGVVVPDFKSLLTIVNEAVKGARAEVPLDYVYEKR